MRLFFLALLALSACRRDRDAYKAPEPDTDGLSDADLDDDGFDAAQGDCDDADAAIHPDAAEACDGIDNDCDGAIDEDATSIFYTDGDGDGYGSTPVEACEPPEGAVQTAGDCDDADAAFHPGAAEDCADPNDYNCDGATGWADGDGDGSPACEDCDDGDAALHPDAAETCDDRDEDCDGTIDEDAVDLATWYIDADADGWGDYRLSQDACDPPDGHAAAAGDCDDADPAFHPGATEACTDPADYNCDGSVGFADVDADGWAACEDCDDADATAYPGGVEVCDGADDDCNGLVDDDAVDASVWYDDDDADGYGDAAAPTSACDAPAGAVADGTDCDDHSSALSPGAVEMCDGLDNDCDGAVDAGALDAPTWHADADADGFGDAAVAVAACDAPPGCLADDTDCDDADDTVHPGATEHCDGEDDDCDGAVDDDPADGTTWYFDADCDGAGGSASIVACDPPSAEHGADGSDCDDGDSLSQPGAAEVCDGADNDCDGAVDDGCVDAVRIGSPSGGGAIDSPANGAACGLFGEMAAGPNPHVATNLPTYMAMLTGASAGLASSADIEVDLLDYSARCGGDRGASVGNFSPSNDWPTLATSGTEAAVRFRGYLNIGCGETLNRTIGLIGNDSLSLSIEGATIMEVNWTDGQWKKFRWVSFPEPGLYAFEVQWSTNLICAIDPFELVWSEGLVAGYDDYDAMCSFATCTYGDGTVIPGFSVIDGDFLVQTTTGGAATCEQCETSADCTTGTCNSAGLCE